MKNNFLLGLAIAATILTSCGDDDVAGVTIIDNSVTNNNGGGSNGGNTNNAVTLAGTYDEDLVLTADKEYNLQSALVMNEGTTLTIQKGTTIKARKGSGVYIAIKQGAKIVANGTADMPIVMTSAESSPVAGNWGGLIILGKAPINSVKGGDETSTSEIGGFKYGGSNEADNSGSLKFVRVEYSGGKVDGQSENNGFSFYGVGNGTTVEYIQAYEGKDDGIEFFGGTVNASYLSVVNCQDDSIDYTEGYKGNITEAYVKHGTEHDKGFECDGYNTDIGNNSDPKFFSNPTVKNVTIEGEGKGEGIRLRAGTKGNFSNIVIKNLEKGFGVVNEQDLNTTTEGSLENAIAGTLTVSAKLTDVEKQYTGRYEYKEGNDKKKVDYTQKVKDANKFFTENDAATGTDYATWGAKWTKK